MSIDISISISLRLFDVRFGFVFMFGIYMLEEEMLSLSINFDS